MMDKHFHVCCEGSFGNRLSGLVGGLTLARLANLPVKVSWPCTNMCRAAFDDIFVTRLNYTDNATSQYYSIGVDYTLLSCEAEYLKFFQATSRVDPAQLNVQSFVETVNSSSKPIFYYTPLLYDWIPFEEIATTVNSLVYTDYIHTSIDNFIDDKFGKSPFDGYHIRTTDFLHAGSSVDVTSIFNIIEASPDKKFFICSDDEKIERRFSCLSNAFTYPKREYTTKLHPDYDWIHPHTDSDGRYSVFNAERSKLSVIDAVIDFMILSRATNIKTANSDTSSTFLRMATILNKCRG